MLAKEMIIQCLNCKNVKSCWFPDRKFATTPINPKHEKLTRTTIDLAAFDIDTLHKFHIGTTSMYIRAVLPGHDQDEIIDMINTSVFVIEALTNSSNAAWECPPDRVYEPKETKVL